jgi:hypothetical protein
MIRRLSKKQMPPELDKAAKSCAAMFRRNLTDPKALTIIPWQVRDKNYRTDVEGAEFRAILRIPRDDGSNFDFVIRLSTVRNDGLEMQTGQQYASAKQPYDLKKAKAIFLEWMQGQPLLKGEKEQIGKRQRVAPEIARIMERVGHRTGDTYGRDAEISRDGRTISMETRTDYDYADYGQYDEPDFPDYVPEMKRALSDYAKYIRSIEGDYSEKGWYGWTVTLK